ncbi:MAG TPA: NAD(+)/NADH kinase [Candidatus Eisenbacteria bacterium]|nr:NAD(+)/NADH kinase [Candidatus Eisenbacteria bacterium]
MTRPPRHLGIVGNRGKEGVRSLLPTLVRWIREQGVPVSVERALGRGLKGVGPGVSLATLVRRSDALLVLGGDGTMLHAARDAREGLPLLGVNLGSLGFLTETGVEALYPALTRLFRGQYEIERRMMLETTIRSAKGARLWSGVGLNDAVIHPRDRSRVIAMDIRIDPTPIGTLVADGLIVATPTGSTAYSLSAGGPIVRPTIEALVATPISPHTLTFRPLLVGGDETIRIALRPGHPRAMLTLDGQVTRLLKPGEEIEIRRARRHVSLITLRHGSFYDVLRTKFAWAEPPRSARPRG